MQLKGKVLAGTSQTVMTKKGTQLAKTRLKVLDTGEEMSGDIQFYWIDFLGEVALADNELESINHKEVTIEVRRVMPSAGNDGKAYINITGGLIYDQNGHIVQTGQANGKK